MRSETSSDLQREILYDAIRRGMEYLARAIDENGRFRYIYDPIKDQAVAGYNILRHAGTLYAMYSWLAIEYSQYLENAAERATAYLLDRIKPFGPNGTSCVVTKGEGKLGGAALTMLALLSREALGKSSSHATTIEQLASFLLELQEEDGKFRSLHFISATPRGFESSYYPAQAIFAIGKLYRISGESRYLRAANVGARFLVPAHGAPLAERDEADHWLLLALSELYQFTPDEAFFIRVRDGAHRIIRQVCRPDGVLGQLVVSNDSYGCGAAATRGEALGAAIALAERCSLPQDAALFEQGLVAVLKFCLRHQCRLEQSLPISSPEKADGGFRRSHADWSIRIDTVQHVASAGLDCLRTH